MWTIAGLAAGWLLKHFTFEVAKYVAFRALLIALIIGFGPIMLFKGFSMILQFMLDYASTYTQGQELGSAVIEMTGIAAYLAVKLKIPEGISVYLSFLSLSFVLRMLRVK